MRYQVPQFIEIEDKIFGPLTFKQFIYLAGAGGICLIFFSIFPIYITVMLGIPVVALGAALAFYHINDRPFIVVMEHAFKYLTGSKLYLWKQRQAETPKTQDAVAKAETQLPVPKLSESKLKDLAWSLNIKDRGVQPQEKRGFEI